MPKNTNQQNMPVKIRDFSSSLKSDNYGTCISKPIHFRSSLPEVILGKGVLKICSKFTGEHP